MPVQMSFEGRNFDIVTGGTAIALALALARADVPRVLVAGWNALGSVLLVNIVGVAIASMPFVHAFGTGQVNVWVLHFPYVWLPAIHHSRSLACASARLAGRSTPGLRRNHERNATRAGRERPSGTRWDA